MKFLKLFIFCITISSFASAQDKLRGELVTKSGDTLQVYANFKSKYTNSEHFGYTLREFGGEGFEVAADNFLSFSSDTKYFVGIDYEMKSTTDRVVAEVFIFGNHYLYVSSNSVGDVIMLYKQGEGEIEEIPRNNLDEFVENNFQLCKSKPYFKRSNYIPSYMKSVLSADNACRNPEKYEFHKSKYPPRFSIGYAYGIQFNKDQSDQEKVEPVYGLGLQGGLRLKLKFATHLAIRYDVTFIRKSSIFGSWKSNLNYLQYPFLFYLMVKDLGKNSNYHISSGATRGRVLSYSSEGANKPSFAAGRPGPRTTGWFVSIARDFNLNNKFHGQLELRYDVNTFQFDSNGRISITEANMTQSAVQIMIAMPF